MDEKTDNKFLWDRKAHKLLSASWRGLRFIKTLFLRLLFPITGLFALIWFLVRIIPKPSRATYPCQRVAFPLASAFVVWLLGIIGSVSAFKKAKFYLNRSRYIIAGFCACVSVGFLWLSLNITNPKQAFADDPTPNSPIGVAKGLYPGRVVWIHDPNATDWDGPGDGHSWEPAHTNQHYVDDMVSRAICELTGQASDPNAWDAIFRHFNQTHGKGSAGYIKGEKITIKVNLTTCNQRLWTVDPATYDKTDYLDKSDTSPQMIVALLRQLVDKVDVEPNDISIGDTVTYFPNQWWDICHSEFPEVNYFDCDGKFGRIKVEYSTIIQHWSHGESTSYETDYSPRCFAEADYIINLAVLKGHGAGITLCGKNHYGSYIRFPDSSGYYDLHASLAGNDLLSGRYRALVDIMGHPHMGGKTLLYMLDGLYGGYYWQGTPYKFLMSPFNDDWPSSLFVSQDPVAIDSVGLDLLWVEWPHVVQIGGVDGYLHEAALAYDPPSGTFYDPNGDGTGLESLGVHEHWNNPVDKQYSRNLGTGDGIELIYARLTNHSPQVDAGSDQSIFLPENTIDLAGVITDDGLPAIPGTVTITWSNLDGPGTVAFGDVHAAETTATFSKCGTYVLRLSAEDGELSSSDDITITVIQPSDFSMDCHVDLKDFAIFAFYWQSESCDSENENCQGADSNGNSNLDFEDLKHFAENWLN